MCASVCTRVCARARVIIFYEGGIGVVVVEVAVVGRPRRRQKWRHRHHPVGRPPLH